MKGGKEKGTRKGSNKTEKPRRGEENETGMETRDYRNSSSGMCIKRGEKTD
jgi:hypothetical protein